MNRTQKFARKTAETDIKGKLNIDGSQVVKVDTGIGFFDHMLTLFAFHGNFDLDIKAIGDIHVCPHHTIEDIAITLGSSLKTILGDNKGVQRYATSYLPMDETLSRTVIDIAGRPYHIFRCQFDTMTVGAFPTEMTKHFFHSFAASASITLHQEVFYGENDHHKIESLFKGFGRALSEATQIVSDQVLSSKGIL